MDTATPNGLRILSLDGGEARCMTQLLILEEFMHRLETDGVACLPCEYFHLVIGAGAGGVVAALLVVFRMSVKEAIQAFARICNAVFAKDDHTPEERSSKLEDTIKQLMRESKISIDRKLLTFASEKPDPVSGCKIAICYVSSRDLSQLRLFRNYRSRRVSYIPTILQAIHASWASPNLFLPVTIGPENLEEELISAIGFNNPSLEAIKEACDVFGPEARISCFLSLGAGRPIMPHSLSSASSTTSILKTFEQLATGCESVAKEMDRRIGRLGIYFRLSVDRGLDFSIHSVDPQRLGEITSYTMSYLLDNAVNKNLDDCVFKSQQHSRISLESLYQSRSTGFTSAAHGLPPLSAFFVARESVIKQMVSALLDNQDQESTQRIMVISGMAGSGKTQVTLKFAREFEDRFQHIFFIDASSSESIKNGIIARIRSLGREYERNRVEDALEVLSDPDANVTPDWCLIFDNADGPSVRISDYFPLCDHGSIIITTRNPLLGDLAPEAHIKLDVMTPQEAVDALIKAAFTRDQEPTDEERIEVRRIAEHLGFLPLAIIQAGCFIKQHTRHALRQYIEHLKTNRRKLLEKPVRAHRDKLKYDHSVYAAFDCSLDALSTRTRQLLSILSTIHFTDFPRSLFSIAAKSQFKYESLELLDRPSTFQDTVDFLSQLFCPTGVWEENELINMLEELQRYSLVSLVPSDGGIVTLRFHPLVHAWACDRMTNDELTVHQAAAVRLLTCGTAWEHEDLFKYISPHINSLSPIWSTLHVNDRSAFGRIIRAEDQAETLMQLSQAVYREVKEVYGEQHIRTSRAALELADAYGEMDDVDTMERMERDVVALRESLLGKEDPETMEAILNLSATLYDKEAYAEAEMLQLEVLRVRKQVLGVQHKDTSEAMIALAETYSGQGRPTEAVALQSTAVETLTILYGRTHIWTLDAIVGLADYYQDLGKRVEADKLQQEVLSAERSSLGAMHVATLGTMEWIGQAYVEQGRYTEAARLWEEIVSARRKVQGSTNLDTVEAISMLARVYETPELGKLEDAERLRRESVDTRRTLQGAQAGDTITSSFWLAKTLQQRGNFTEAAEIMNEVINTRKLTLGDDNVDTLNALGAMARIHHDLGNHAEAKALRQMEVEKRRSIQGANHAQRLDSLSWLARAHAEQGHHGQAEIVLREEVELRKKAQGENVADTLNALLRLVQVVLKQGRYVEAEQDARDLVQRRKATSGLRDVETLKSMDWLARCVYEQGRLKEAESMRIEELALRREVHGDDPAYYNCLSYLIKIYISQGRPPDVERACLELVEARKRMLGVNNMATFTAIHWLSWAYQQQGRYEEARILLEEILPLTKEANGDSDIDILSTLERLVMISYAQGKFDDMLEFAKEHLHRVGKKYSQDSTENINARALVAWSISNRGQYSEAIEMFQDILTWRCANLGTRDTSVGVTKMRIAEAYHAIGRDMEARSLAEEALAILAEKLKPGDAILKATLALVQKVGGARSSATPNQLDVVEDHPLPGPNITLDEMLAPDPDDESNTLHQPQAIALPLPNRFNTPFEQRRAFGRQPGNSWSMFY